MTKESDIKVIEVASRDLVRIERKCFYGDEPERDRLRKMRELIDEVCRELTNDN